MGSQEISIIIAACSALFSAISAGVNLWNTNTLSPTVRKHDY